MMPDQKKRYRDRAIRAQRALAKEKAEYGEIGDGSGKRYRIGVYFLLAGELERATAAFEAFDIEFPEDIGEPIFLLYGALTAYRSGDLTKARAYLREAVLSNFFLVPYLIGEEFQAPGVKHWSNWEEEEYFDPYDELLDEPTGEERIWMATEWHSETFVKMKKRYLGQPTTMLGEVLQRMTRWYCGSR
jgi:tetratricopeptide (TPR) repeat protein